MIEMRERQRKRERERGRQTDRQRERQTRPLFLCRTEDNGGQPFWWLFYTGMVRQA